MRWWPLFKITGTWSLITEKGAGGLALAKIEIVCLGKSFKITGTWSLIPL
jgi:hypothetical protein